MPRKEVTLVHSKRIQITPLLGLATCNLFVKNTMGSDLKLSDKRIFDLLCSGKGFPEDTLIAEKRVRKDWTVTSVFFPSRAILWITETEW